MPGPEGPALVAPKGLLFNSHWHVAEHPEMGPKEFELSLQTPGRFQGAQAARRAE
jgi:hypothetical protein